MVDESTSKTGVHYQKRKSKHYLLGNLSFLDIVQENKIPIVLTRKEPLGRSATPNATTTHRRLLLLLHKLLELIKWVQMTCGHNEYTRQEVLEELVFVRIADFNEALTPRLKPRGVCVGDEVVAVQIDLFVDVSVGGVKAVGDRVVQELLS